jgi:glycosyltransferase involved in cell wall biosynthesis
MERADRVICISENTRNDLIRLFDADERKVEVVHLAFDRFAPADTPAPLPELDRPFLLYVGHRGGYKNFANFLRAVMASGHLAKDVDIVAFGGPPFAPGEKLFISSLGFRPDQVRYLRGGDDLLAALYTRARALVYPSRYEGFGIPPLEAMSYECPVICSNTSSLPEVVGTAGEYFSPLDVDDMRQAIERVVYSEVRTAELRVAGLKRSAQFSWTRCAEQTLAVYKSVV